MTNLPVQLEKRVMRDNQAQRAVMGEETREIKYKLDKSVNYLA